MHAFCEDWPIYVIGALIRNDIKVVIVKNF